MFLQDYVDLKVEGSKLVVTVIDSDIILPSYAYIARHNMISTRVFQKVQFKDHCKFEDVEYSVEEWLVNDMDVSNNHFSIVSFPQIKVEPLNACTFQGYSVDN